MAPSLLPCLYEASLINVERLPQSVFVCACASMISHRVTLPNEGGVGRLLVLEIVTVFVFVAQTFFPFLHFVGVSVDIYAHMSAVRIETFVIVALFSQWE